MKQSSVGRGALAHRLRGVAIAQQNVEDSLRFVEIIVGERVEAIPFLGREAERAVRRHQRPERALHLLAVAALEIDQRGAQQRHFLIELVDVLVLGDRIQFRERARLVLAQFGGADARQRRIALGTVLGESVESVGGFFGFPVIREGDCSFEAGIGGLSRLLAIGLVIAPGARRGDDQHGEDQDRRLIAPPKLSSLVAPDVFIDLMENIGHLLQTLDSARKSQAGRSR